LALVRAMIWKPDLILLDEPFSALDPALRGALRTELIRLHELCPAPLLIVTHDEADLAQVSTRRLHVQSEGQRRKFMNAPSTQRDPIN
jgi:ABC-type sulfate/molybdate transport systems ATPase subunit